MILDPRSGHYGKACVRLPKHGTGQRGLSVSRAPNAPAAGLSVRFRRSDALWHDRCSTQQREERHEADIDDGASRVEPGSAPAGMGTILG
jgi:hypothetical protein